MRRQGARGGGGRDGVWTWRQGAHDDGWRNDARRRQQARDGGATMAGVVARASGTHGARQRQEWPADMGARASNHVAHGSALGAARPGRTGECVAESGGRAADEEVEMAEAEPKTPHGPAICDLVSIEWQLKLVVLSM